MKKNLLFFTLLFLGHYSVASDAYPEATIAVLNELGKQYIDSHQIDIGGNLFYRQSNFVSAINLKSTLFFKRKYHVGASFNATSKQENHQDFVVSSGINVGFRGFNPQLGKVYADLLLGLGLGKVDNVERLIIEPSVIFPLTESQTIRSFWLRHKLGINAAIAYRHTIDPDNILQFEDTNVIKLYLHFFIHQKTNF